MSSLFENILHKNGYPLQGASKQLKRLQLMSADEFAEWQINKRWEIAKHHYDNNELYQELVGNTFPDNWDDLPVVTKKHLQEPLKKVTTKGIKSNECYRGSTSGSTGTPFYFLKDRFSHAMTWAVIEDRYSWYEIDLSSLQARFYGMPAEAFARGKEIVKDKLMKRFRFNVFDLSDESFKRYTSVFAKKKFKYLYGYTSPMVAYARYLAEQSIVLKEVCPTLKVCICTSETCTDEDRVIMEEAFGRMVVREYGLSETCLTAFDHPDATWRLTEESLYTEAIGEKIVTTSLFNTAFPMVRYETGDTGVIKENSNGHRVLEQFTGRTNDMILLPDGRKAAGLTFYYISRSLLEQTGVLKEFIIRQTTLNDFVFDIVSDREFTSEEIELVKHKTRSYLNPDAEVKVNRVDKIQRPESGKLKHFYSEIKQG